MAILNDGHKGFAELAEHIKDPEVRNFFSKESHTRAQYAMELESAAGLKNEERGTVTGAIHRFWGEMKGKMGGGDHALLETAEQGEDAAKEAYEEALKEKTISPNLMQILRMQQGHILQAHDPVKAFRDSKKPPRPIA